MSDGRCKTCKHWNNQPEYHGLGTCEATPMLFDSQEWDEQGMSRHFKPEFEHTTAFAQDGSDYSASLYTKPEHGCTMHQAKP